jgi:hypothetical protein
MREAVIVDALRTPIGRYGGVLSGVRPDDLAARVVRAAVERNELDPASVEEVYLGCANQAGEDNRNIARMAALLAGLPPTVPGLTVNRLCASGLEAAVQASRQIRLGEADLVLAGGVESMSRAPLAALKPERGFARGNVELVDTTIGWRFVNPFMAATHSTESMGETAENVAERYGVSREDQDAFALESHRRALAVGPSQVVQLVEASDGRLVAEGAMWSAVIVGPEPAVESARAFGAGGVDGAVGPAGQQGADEALCFAVGAGPVRAGAQVTQAERAAGERVDGRAITGAVV